MPRLLSPRRVLLGSALGLSLLAGPARAEPGLWQVDASRSRITVQVYRSGGFSHFLHDHHFVPTEVAGRLAFDPAKPEAAQLALTVGAGSLRDHQPELKPADEEKVNSQVAGPEVLDAEHHPTITFKANWLENVKRPPPEPGKPQELTGELVGTLDLHGVSRPVRVPVRATIGKGSLHATGRATIKQSDFGIKPLHKGMGAIAVKDQVDIDFDVEAKLEGKP